jgi:hypothetical protein
VSILKNIGDGTFDNAVDYLAAPRARSIAVGQFIGDPDSIATADINGDGAVDIVAVEFVSNAVEIFFNRGDGTLCAPRIEM